MTITFNIQIIYICGNSSYQKNYLNNPYYIIIFIILSRGKGKFSYINFHQCKEVLMQVVFSMQTNFQYKQIFNANNFFNASSFLMEFFFSMKINFQCK